ncbi:MAG: phosphopantetheine-binding protein [Clostridiales bacterium]|jgi:acyl carrier protein|nr:phosphopantetheine-binding protein [Clostridiales bacterium]
MDKQEVFLKLAGKINEQTGGSETVIQLSSKIMDIGLNSIDFIKILVFVEDEFGIEFDDNDLLMEKYQVVEDMVDLICLYMKRNSHD